MKYLCRAKNINRGTVIETNAPVVKISQFSPLEPNNSFNLAVSILVLILFIILKIFSLDFYLILSVAVLFAVSNFVLMPLINKFRDEKQDKKFKQSHFVSVVINFVQMILLVIVLI